uniref:MATH domain-containing protein n=1 Tax=Meloidogyne incognita TaxID=6306 RepID=A0A914KMP0_MELIC
MFSDVTEVEILKCEIEWKLYDFYKHETFMENGQFLTSKQFYNPKCPYIKWELRIYPNNNPEDPRILISLVQVGLENSDDSLKARFYICTLDNKGEKVFYWIGNTFSFKNQIESDKYELRRRTMPDSPLIIFCEVEFVPYKIKLENEFVDYSTPKNSFMEIFKQGILTDCVFEISFSKEYLA